MERMKCLIEQVILIFKLNFVLFCFSYYLFTHFKELYALSIFWMDVLYFTKSHWGLTKNVMEREKEQMSNRNQGTEKTNIQQKRVNFTS